MCRSSRKKFGIPHGFTIVSPCNWKVRVTVYRMFWDHTMFIPRMTPRNDRQLFGVIACNVQSAKCFLHFGVNEGTKYWKWCIGASTALKLRSVLTKTMSMTLGYGYEMKTHKKKRISFILSFCTRYQLKQKSVIPPTAMNLVHFRTQT